jgi:coenzyme F420-reducing hydrogenase beta subunit
MKRLFILLVLAAVAIGALGYKLGWYHVDSTNADGQSKVTVTVDKDKIHQDEQKAKDKVKDLDHQVKDKAADTIRDRK